MIYRPHRNANSSEVARYYREIAAELDARGIGYGERWEPVARPPGGSMGRLKFAPDRAESRRAALHNWDRRPGLWKLILLRLAEVSLTTDELQVALGAAHQTCSARVSELLDDDFIQQARDENGVELRRKTRSGEYGAVWTLTARARAVLDGALSLDV